MQKSNILIIYFMQLLVDSSFVSLT